MSDKPRRSSDVAALQRALGSVAEVWAPEDAEEPILAPATRGAVFEWLAELRAEDELRAVGLKPRATALLHGPPGCGKTTLAHHLAARLGVPLVLVGAEKIFKPYLGESEQALDRLFKGLAMAGSPCIAFLDEIEAIGGKRAMNSQGGADNARTAVLTVLLRRIEQFDGLLVAATNRPQDLDPALWRRFNLQVAVDLPGDDERFAILRRYGLPFDFAERDLDLLCRLTDGASPALLRGVMEGVKRGLVIGGRLGRDVSDPAAAFARVVASVMPPPEIASPPLWEAGGTRELRGMQWPLRRSDGEGT